MVVCKDWLEKLRASRNRGVDVVAVVENDVSAILNGKSLEQLSQLQRQIQAKLASGELIDVDYWEGLLKNLLVWKAKVSFINCSKSRNICELNGISVLVGEAERST